MGTPYRFCGHNPDTDHKEIKALKAEAKTSVSEGAPRDSETGEE